MESASKTPLSGARTALFLLLAINLFNYIDRQILAALEPDIRGTFFAANDVNAMTKTGLLGDAFFVKRCERRLRPGGDIRDSLCNSRMRWNWRGRLRTGSADDFGRSFPDRNTWSHHGDLLRGDSGR